MHVRSSTPNAQNGGGHGGRKAGLNGNHLLNFSLPTRQERPAAPRRSRKAGGGEGARWQIFNKEKFVNASFRFMMKPTGDYTAHFTDSDIFFHWPDILQILIPPPVPTLLGAPKVSAAATSAALTGLSLPSCPICLGDPVAPRMTKCGHVYCFSCVLHYLALSDEKFAKCPICTDAVWPKDLKCVAWAPTAKEPTTTTTVTGPTFDAAVPGLDSSVALSSAEATGPSTSSSNLTTHLLRLVQRPQHTSLALPRSSTWPSPAIPPLETPYAFLPDVSTFARFMLATPEELVRTLERDLRELETERRVQARAGEDAVGLSFLDAAKGKVMEQIARAKSELATETVRRKMEEVVALAEGAERRGAVEKERVEKEIARRHQEKEARLSAAAVAAAAPTGASSPKLLAATPSWDGFTEPTTAATGFEPIPPPTTTLPPPPSSGGGALPSSSDSAAAPSLLPPSSSTVSDPSVSVPSFSSSRPPKSKPKPRLPPPAPEPSFFFYQSYTGLPIYLHPLDIRILLHEHRCYSAFPGTLEVAVEAAEEGTMNDDLRRRCKYLAHLPTGAGLVFLEINLPKLVSPQTLAAFEGPLKQRRARRRERGKREERERKRAEEADREREGSERRAVGMLSETRRSSTREDVTAAAGADDFEAALERSLRESQPGFDHDLAGSTHPPSGSILSSSPPTGDFAAGWGTGGGGRSFASTVGSGGGASPGVATWGMAPRDGRRSAADQILDEAELTALWRQFDTVEGDRNRREREGESEVNSGGAVSAPAATGGGAGQKKKKKGQKVFLTGGGGRGAR